ncbi:hypothetical protein K438DRAFT_1976162 [Mycena galopus ATCC 62051]|nr:hypothetical protein K438DRAFT_1976162 [Mycena galopus ATCC 62051]
MPPKRPRKDSDGDYRAPSTLRGSKRARADQHFFQTSSAPTSPRLSAAPEVANPRELDRSGTLHRLPDLMSRLVDPKPGSTPRNSGSGSGSAAETPKKQRAVSETPTPVASPATSTIFEPSPLKSKGGRPRVKRATRNPRHSTSEMTPVEREQLRVEAATARRVRENEQKKAKRAEAAQTRRVEQEAAAQVQAEKDHLRAQSFFAKITASEEDGGAGFRSVRSFVDSLFATGCGGDAQIATNLTRFLQNNGGDVLQKIVDRVPEVGEEFLDRKFDERLENLLKAEGKAIQEHLTRHWTTNVTELLKEFSMEKLGDDLQKIAPTLWKILERVAIPGRETRREGKGESRREKSLIFTSVCAMLSMSRSQKANNYQIVIGMFLLASGSAKREMEVLAHAGFRGFDALEAACERADVSIVWDNLNIAFRVESQRLNSANHFDNGTTATAIPIWNPFTNGPTALGTLPLEMKPPRTSTFPIIDWTPEDILPSPTNMEQLSQCCLWQIKRLALENIPGLAHVKKDFEGCPEVDPIAVHKTEQYPLPAMHEDESSIDGTIRVYERILQNLGITNEDLRAHGLMFTDGDLLTDSLIDKACLIESARRNSDGEIEGMKASVRRFGLFHAKMAGARLVVNEHWGQPNSVWPGSLWWEHNKLLKRKPMTAGWKAKKATPWKPSHELLQISLAAHVKDGFRIYCDRDDLDAWAATASLPEFNAVAERVYCNLFSTAALDKLRTLRPELRDITHENVILLNRDALFYIEFVFAIKKGDIGRVINVLRVWMVMMRSSKTMPKYADAIFETLARIDRYDPVLKKFFLHNWLVNLTGLPFSFKEVDLLQEHQNFWAKIIYNAKGVNRSWEWLSMITVCIFTLRQTMRTVQKSFNIPAYGEHHTVPDMSSEIQKLADAFQDERIQEYIVNRPSNDPSNSTAVTPVRDLFEEGSKYADTRAAFKKYTRMAKKPENIGVVEVMEDGVPPEPEEKEDDTMNEDYQVTEDDLRVDDEELYSDPSSLLSIATDLIGAL